MDMEATTYKQVQCQVMRNFKEAKTLKLVMALNVVRETRDRAAFTSAKCILSLPNQSCFL